MGHRRVEHRIDNKCIGGSEALELIELRSHRFGGTAAVSRSFDYRVGAVATALGTAALGLYIQNPAGFQVTCCTFRRNIRLGKRVLAQANPSWIDRNAPPMSNH